MKKIMIASALLLTTCISYGQKLKMAVLPVDSKGVLLDQQQLSNLLQIEVDKIQTFQVYDKYEVQNKLEQSQINVSNCFALSCLIEAGKALKVDRVMTGSVERYNEKIMITLRVVDVAKGVVEKTHVDEYLNIQPELKNMLMLSVHNLYAIQNDPEVVAKLTKESAYESSMNNPGNTKLNLGGPRMGLTFVTGESGKRLTDAKTIGGYDAFPLMTQFGYQFETQYLNSGNFQALFEFIPTITGLDQGFFIPSITILNGLRDNKSGWEFAFGPAFGLMKKAEGYYENGNWHLSSDWTGNTSNPYPLIERFDRRGDIALSSGFVLAVGKTFRSAALNIPVNFYMIPGKDGVRVGLSFGFNTKK